MRIIKSHKSFEGKIHFCEHDSQQTKTPMKFAAFVPPGPIKSCLIWLSGLTCNEENFISKAGAQPHLAAAHMLLICPDTSPRGLQLPHEHESWDFGSGAGFYLDATTSPYNEHYRMYSYITADLVPLIRKNFAIGDRLALSGHSMGGHGALVLGLREPELFRSVSAFAPIANPMQCPWGQKAFRAYLGESSAQWARYDACALLEAGFKHPRPLLIDQGTEDNFLKEQQLLPENLIAASQKAGQRINVRLREGYDHSYYFIASFISSHIEFHAQALAESE